LKTYVSKKCDIKMDKEIRNKIERMKIKAEDLYKENSRAFIIDSNNTYFFCNILNVGDTRLFFHPFIGNDCGKDIDRLWADILDVREYIDKEELI